jgi:hypothetical protein
VLVKMRLRHFSEGVAIESKALPPLNLLPGTGSDFHRRFIRHPVDACGMGADG